MNESALSIENTGLALSLLLVASVLILLWVERLRLHKELTIAVVRCFVQLVVLGLVIDYIFELDRLIWTLTLISAMVVLGGHTSCQRAVGFARPWLFSMAALASGAAVSLGVVFVFRIVDFEPRYLIPLAGMVIGNATRTLSLSLDRLGGEMNQRRPEIELALSLGASTRAAAQFSRWAALRASLIPSIDGMKIIGLIQIPGAMLGVLMAGGSPMQAVKLQVVIMYLLLSSNTITSVVGVELAYRVRFTAASQLKPAGAR